MVRILKRSQIPWKIGKISRVRKEPYHIVFLNPAEKDSYAALLSAIRGISDLQRAFTEVTLHSEGDLPAPVVASFVMTPKEAADRYPYRLSVFLPPQLFKRGTAEKLHRDAEWIKTIGGKQVNISVSGARIPVTAWRKTDIVVANSAEETIRRFGVSPHLVGHSVAETAASVALARARKNWKIARNVYVTVPSHVKTRVRKNMGRTVTELDILATDGKNVHVGEIKGVGPNTWEHWPEIVVRKAITITPAIEMLKEAMNEHRNRLFPHFIVVSRREHLSTELANRALIALKPHETFDRMEAHAVWPGAGGLQIKSFKEPLGRIWPP